MQAETTINKLAEDLLNAIYEKFIKCSSSSNDDEEEVEDEMNGEMDHLHKKAGESPYFAFKKYCCLEVIH